MEWMKDFQEFMTKDKVELVFDNGVITEGNVVFVRNDEKEFGLGVIGYYDGDGEFQDDNGKIQVEDMSDIIDFETGEGLTPIK